MKIIRKELIGASAIPIILCVLQNGDSYGYEIVKLVKKLTNGGIEWKEASIYPVLQKLEKSGFIKSYWKIRKDERPRKYYTIEAGGKKQLEKSMGEWNMVRLVFKELQK